MLRLKALPDVLHLKALPDVLCVKAPPEMLRPARLPMTRPA
jgi:hypothetical protein